MRESTREKVTVLKTAYMGWNLGQTLRNACSFLEPIRGVQGRICFLQKCCRTAHNQTPLNKRDYGGWLTVPSPASHVTPKPPHSRIKNFYILNNWLDVIVQISSLSGGLLGVSIWFLFCFHDFYLFGIDSLGEKFGIGRSWLSLIVWRVTESKQQH